MRTLVTVAGAALALGFAACGGGSGPMPSTNPGGDEGAGSTYEPPVGTRDDPGGNCLQCDVSYDCPNFASGGTLDITSSSGECTQAIIDFICSGALFGASGCSGGGGGTFTCGNVTCTPQVFSTGSSSGATPGGGQGVDGG